MLKIFITFFLITQIICTQCINEKKRTNIGYADPLYNVNNPLTINETAKYYLSFPVKKNWFLAYQFCANRGQELLTVESRETQKEVESFIASKNLTKIFYKKRKEIWTSGTDNGKEGHFFWLTSGNAFNFTNWHKRVPSRKAQKNCVSMMYLKNRGFIWKDNKCLLDLYFICQNYASIDIRMN